MLDDVPSEPTKAHTHWVRIVEAAHAKIAPHIAKAKTAQVAGMLETIEQDLQPLVAPFVKELAADPSTPPEIRNLLAPLVEPTHFSESIVIGIAIGAILQPVLGAALDPLVTELAKSSWNAAIGSAGALGGIPLSPALLATAVLKGVITESTGAQQAQQSGVTSSAFHNMVQTAGQSIGIEQALLLYRRGQIDEAELERVVRYSDVRIDFLEDIKALRFAPPGAGDVITGRLKGHLTDAQATKQLGEAGIDPTNYDWMLATAGRPPGTEQMLHLWNRGVATEADVDAAVRQSDINDHYLPFVKELKHYYPPPRSLVPMLRSKAITETQFRLWMSFYGAEPDVVDAFLKEGTKPASTTIKELTAAKIVELYEDKIITRAECVTRIDTLGYNADDAESFAKLADANVEGKLRTSAVGKIHARYVTYKIDKPTATTHLNGVGLPQASVTQLFQFWDDERATLAPALTVAQWQGAFRRGLKTHAEFVAGVRAYGYDADEAETLAGLALPPPALPKSAKSKDLTASQLVRLFQEGGITATVLRTRLLDLGYDPTEAGEIVALAPTDLTVAQLTKLYTATTIDAATFRARLLSMGYTDADATRIISLAPPPNQPG